MKAFNEAQSAHPFGSIGVVLGATLDLGRYGIEGPLNDQLKALKASGDPDWLFKWVSNAPKIKPGIIMPVWLDKEGGQLDEASIRLVVQYLQGLGK